MPGGWRGRGNWPGAGPFSNLPPWQRPGWLHGRGACWRFYAPIGSLPTSVSPELKPEDEATLLTEQRLIVEEHLRTMQETLKNIQHRFDELKKQA
jgi:hypothetical protein